MSLAAQGDMPKDDRRRILAEATALVGRERIAESLGVGDALLEGWIRGEAAIPDRVMLQVSAILARQARRES